MSSRTLSKEIYLKVFRFQRQKDEEEDVVDSDFSIDEQDEPVSDQEDAPDKKRKRGGVNTKAYKVSCATPIK